MLNPRTFDSRGASSCPSPFKSFPQVPRCTYGTSVQHMESIFIQALVRAGQCSRHSENGTSNVQFASRCSARRRISNASIKSSVSCQKPFSTRTTTQMEATAFNVSREELKRLVDFYSVSPQEEVIVPSLGMPLDDQGHHLPPHPPTKDDIDAIERNLRCLRELLANEQCSHEAIWETYQSLPHPRASHLPESILNSLLHHLSIVEHKTETGMLRYLSLLDDVRAADKPIHAAHWTSAISFAGRCLTKISDAQVESALQIWRNMEHDAGVKGTHVTFNVLFDMATKAGKFVLAEMIMKEMQTRNLRQNRHFRTALIFHHGLRRDGNAVRAAYRALVDAGELVDTAVINCVVASLLKCGEAVAAEQVFERAKRLHAQKLHEHATAARDHASRRPPPLPPTGWRARRALGLTLDRAAHTLRADPSGRDLVQDAVPLAPDARTYGALVYYHAVSAGDVDRATELVDEMAAYDIPVEGALFLSLFKGFGMHGGVAYTGWTRRRLESVWARFGGLVDESGAGWVRSGDAADVPQHAKTAPPTTLQAPATIPVPTPKTNNTSHQPLQQSQPPSQPPRPARLLTYMSRTSAEYVLRAYAKAAGHERTVEVWREIWRRWGLRIGDEDKRYLEGVMGRLFPDEFVAGDAVQVGEAVVEDEGEGGGEGYQSEWAGDEGGEEEGEAVEKGEGFPGDKGSIKERQP